MKWTLSLINCTNDPMLRLIGFLVCPFENACSIIAVLRSYVTLKLDKKWQPREIAFTYIYIYTQADSTHWISNVREQDFHLKTGRKLDDDCGSQSASFFALPFCRAP